MTNDAKKIILNWVCHWKITSGKN